MLHWTHGGLIALVCEWTVTDRKWRFKLAENLEEALRAPPTRQLLFGSDAKYFDADWTGDHMSFVMAIAAWQDNVLYFERRLVPFRDHAIEEPSSRNFESLALLRRNIVDLENALLRHKKNISPLAKYAYEQRRRAIDGELPSLEEQYDALLQRIKALSNALDSEIRLVIGSLAFQVSINPPAKSHTLS